MQFGGSNPNYEVRGTRTMLKFFGNISVSDFLKAFYCNVLISCSVCHNKSKRTRNYGFVATTLFLASHLGELEVKVCHIDHFMFSKTSRNKLSNTPEIVPVAVFVCVPRTKLGK